MRLVSPWLLPANHSARVDRHRTWHSLSCLDIKCTSPMPADEKASHIYASHHETTASRPPDQKHRGCDFGKLLGPNIIDHAPSHFHHSFCWRLSNPHITISLFCSLYPHPDAFFESKTYLVHTYLYLSTILDSCSLGYI